MMDESDIERLREEILAGKRRVARAHHRDTMAKFKASEFDDLAEATIYAGLDPDSVSDDEVGAAIGQAFTDAAAMRAYMTAHGAGWRESVRAKWEACIAQLERR